MDNTVKLKIWNRELEIPCVYDCYGDEEILEVQTVSLQNFLSHPEWIENSKNVVELYCKEQVLSDQTITDKTDVFKYLKPESIFIKRDLTLSRVALMCKYKYDLEHGIAVVFTSDGEISIGSQDMIL